LIKSYILWGQQSFTGSLYEQIDKFNDDINKGYVSINDDDIFYIMSGGNDLLG